MRRSAQYRLELHVATVAVVLVGMLSPTRGARLAVWASNCIARREYRRILADVL